jgi:hypothetical protein
MTDGVDAVSYGYDKQGRMIHIQRNGIPTITYTHDIHDCITSLHVDDFYHIEYNYDFLGQLSAISRRGHIAESFTFVIGQALNFFGRHSNWIGANRSGGKLSKTWQSDFLGRLPLGNTEVGITGKNLRWDEAAKWHDTGLCKLARQ